MYVVHYFYAIRITGAIKDDTIIFSNISFFASYVWQLYTFRTLIQKG